MARRAFVGTEQNNDWVSALPHLSAPDGLYVYSEDSDVRRVLLMRQILIIVLGSSLILALWIGM
jgi:hypothetical protein